MKYYVNDNAQVGGEHEVHNDKCSWLPKPENRTYLGEFPSCKSAVSKAKDFYSNVDGCAHCSVECHTR